MKKDFQLFCCFRVTALLFVSARPILDHLLPIFYGFSSKTARYGSFSAENCDFFLSF